MRRAAAVLLIVVALTACKAKTPEQAAAGEITDDEVSRFVTWNREWADLAKKHYEEADKVSKRIADKYFPDLSKMQTDPELLSTLERQRGEMQEHMDRCPLKGDKLEAMKAVYAGIIPKRDEQALSQARARYGGKAVDRILAHESEITALMQAWR